MPLFPPIEPYASGMLDVGDDQSVYWECCGNPHGQPALYLHGGPGGGIGTGARRYFDPKKYCVVLFDQRGCGRSRPSAADPLTDLSVNTTQHLIADIEELRELHEVQAWTVLGTSWGSTLGLAYAQAHPERVNGLVLAAVTTTSAREVQWITEDVGRLFPREWERFTGAVPERLRTGRLIDAYATMLNEPDPSVREHAAREWCLWEDAHVSLTPGGHRPHPRYQDPDFRYLFARLVTHYWSNAAFLPDGQLSQDIATLNGIPGTMIHGRYDISGPLDTAWRLHQRWETSELRVIDDAGHGGTETFTNAVVDALDSTALTSGTC
ncbi:prolyl aminopeptidase [Pseudonocardia sp. RS010]|uniref:prolyl aminopeptidase n=1 Tax=Pseudonocardia sp. RS010 TaxID=3385979 RepID=UPI00399F3C86